MKSVKERIQKLCKTRNISLHKLETDLGFGNSTIRKWDKTQPRIDKLQAVADYFGVDVSEIAVYNSVSDAPPADIESIQYSLYNALDDMPKAERDKKLLEIMPRLLEIMNKKD